MRDIEEAPLRKLKASNQSVSFFWVGYLQVTPVGMRGATSISGTIEL